MSETKYPTVAEYAEERDVSISTVRRAILRGFLKAKKESQRGAIRIVSGDLTMPRHVWQRKASDILAKTRKKGTHGVDGDVIEVLIGEKVVTYSRPKTSEDTERQFQELRSL